MAEEIKPTEEQVEAQAVSETVEEAAKIDSKIKLMALALLNFKKLVIIVVAVAISASLIVIALSGWSCGNVKKDSVELRK
jgi:hypothetical protein